MSRPNENSEMDYIPMNKRVPILVASSSNVNEKVVDEAKTAGFAMVLSSPLTADTIKEEIIPLIKKR